MGRTEVQVRLVMHHGKKYLLMKKVKTHNFNDIQEEEEECVSNEHIRYAIVSQNAEEKHERRNFIFNLALPLIKISSKI